MDMCCETFMLPKIKFVVADKKERKVTVEEFSDERMLEFSPFGMINTVWHCELTQNWIAAYNTNWKEFANTNYKTCDDREMTKEQKEELLNV